MFSKITLYIAGIAFAVLVVLAYTVPTLTFPVSLFLGVIALIVLGAMLFNLIRGSRNYDQMFPYP